MFNTKNEDNKFLVLCPLAFKLNLGWIEKPERVAHYILLEKLSNMKFSVSLQIIPIIDDLNNLRITVLDYEEDEVCPLYVSSKEDFVGLTN